MAQAAPSQPYQSWVSPPSTTWPDSTIEGDHLYLGGSYGEASAEGAGEADLKLPHLLGAPQRREIEKRHLPIGRGFLRPECRQLVDPELERQVIGDEAVGDRHRLSVADG